MERKPKSLPYDESHNNNYQRRQPTQIGVKNTGVLKGIYIDMYYTCTFITLLFKSILQANMNRIHEPLMVFLNIKHSEVRWPCCIWRCHSNGCHGNQLSWQPVVTATSCHGNQLSRQPVVTITSCHGNSWEQNSVELGFDFFISLVYIAAYT